MCHGRTMTGSTVHIYLNPVRADRAAAFEQFLEMTDQAVSAQRPELASRWQVLKAVAPEPADPNVITYAFLFDGGDLDADWDLDVLLPAHYGAEEAGRMLAAWSDTFATYGEWVAALGDHDDGITQVGWTFSVLRGS